METRFLGIDYGTRRIGLSFGDSLGVAVPLPAVLVSSKERALAQIAEVARDRRVEALVVGYPFNMDGSVGFKAQEVDSFIHRLQAVLPLPVHRVDERLTTQLVDSQLRAWGRKSSSHRRTRADGSVDSRAAALILQDFLDQREGLPEPDLP